MDYELINKYRCPMCLQGGKNSRLVCVYYKKEEAFYTCEDTNCIYFVTDMKGNPIKYKYNAMRKMLIPVLSDDSASYKNTITAVSIKENEMHTNPSETLLPFLNNQASQSRKDQTLFMNTVNGHCQHNELDRNIFEASDYFKPEESYPEFSDENILDVDYSFLDDFMCQLKK